MLEKDNRRLLDLIDQRDREINEIISKNIIKIDNQTLENRVQSLNEEIV